MDLQAISGVLGHALNAKAKIARQPSGDPSRHIDLWLDVKIGRSRWRFAVEQKSSAGQAIQQVKAHQRALRSRGHDVIPVLAVPRLSRRERANLRENDVNYLDMSGNVSIRSDGLVVSIEGGEAPLRQSPRKSKRNPFSKKASLVARILLAQPFRKWRVREVSAEGSLSVGFASEILRSMVAAAYVAESAEGFQLADPVSLLKDWSASYRWEDNKIHSFVAPFDKSDLLERASRVVESMDARPLLTLLSAADILLPHVQHEQVHLYVDHFSPSTVNALRSQLHAESVQHGGNLHVMEPYYGRSVWYVAQQLGGFELVSDVQLLLDLVHYPVRGPEAGGVLLRKRIGPRLHLNREQVRSLEEGLGF